MKTKQKHGQRNDNPQSDHCLSSFAKSFEKWGWGLAQMRFLPGASKMNPLQLRPEAVAPFLAP